MTMTEQQVASQVKVLVDEYAAGDITLFTIPIQKILTLILALASNDADLASRMAKLEAAKAPPPK